MSAAAAAPHAVLFFGSPIEVGSPVTSPPRIAAAAAAVGPAGSAVMIAVPVSISIAVVAAVAVVVVPVIVVRRGSERSLATFTLDRVKGGTKDLREIHRGF